MEFELRRVNFLSPNDGNTHGTGRAYSCHSSPMLQATEGTRKREQRGGAGTKEHTQGCVGWNLRSSFLNHTSSKFFSSETETSNCIHDTRINIILRIWAVSVFFPIGRNQIRQQIPRLFFFFLLVGWGFDCKARVTWVKNIKAAGGRGAVLQFFFLQPPWFGRPPNQTLTVGDAIIGCRLSSGILFHELGSTRKCTEPSVRWAFLSPEFMILLWAFFLNLFWIDCFPLSFLPVGSTALEYPLSGRQCRIKPPLRFASRGWHANIENANIEVRMIFDRFEKIQQFPFVIFLVIVKLWISDKFFFPRPHKTLGSKYCYEFSSRLESYYSNHIQVLAYLVQGTRKGIQNLKRRGGLWCVSPICFPPCSTPFLFWPHFRSSYCLSLTGETQYS